VALPNNDVLCYLSRPSSISEYAIMTREAESPRIVVTGANSGIGWVAARQLAQDGAEVILVCRSAERGQDAMDRIRAVHAEANLTLMQCDLSDQESIQSFSRRFRERYDRLDVLLNNAGAYIADHGLTADQLETTFALNHMGYFLTTRGLMPCLRAAEAARVVNVSSMGHRMGHIDFNDMQYQKRAYKAMPAYCASKLMNIHFTKALATRLVPSAMTTNCLHPGAIRSGFAVKEGDFFGGLVRFGSVFLTSPEKGARTSIFLASDPSVASVSGAYFSGCKVKKPSRAARHEETSERLWSASESLIRFDPAL
jgi:retinol dehydrogenase-12